MTAMKLPAIFSGIRSRKDRSFSMTFETRELAGKDAAALLNMQQTECWLIVAPSEDAVDAADVPDYKADSGAGAKTPAQRLRSVMFIWYKQHGGKDVHGDFDTFYARRIESLIDKYKDQLDGEPGW